MQRPIASFYPPVAPERTCARTSVPSRLGAVAVTGTCWNPRTHPYSGFHNPCCTPFFIFPAPVVTIRGKHTYQPVQLTPVKFLRVSEARTSFCNHNGDHRKLVVSSSHLRTTPRLTSGSIQTHKLESGPCLSLPCKLNKMHQIYLERSAGFFWSN